ncbi:MAG TPA: sulfatase-like hydrolase/transferase [Vicinamibacterales bacterium]|nr:sulfatase-like hydrolase/transferase [Vicinamibacterales bacterium]
MPKTRRPKTVSPVTRPPHRVRVVAGIALVAVCALGVLLWVKRTPSPPRFLMTADQNVLLITIDTLRADALGVYGGRAATPNLDRLAKGGIRFTFAHSHAVVTLPSHTSILTGRYPFEHGVRDNAGYRLADSATTVAEAAHAKGFATGGFVGAFPLDRQFGVSQGFDVYDDVSGSPVAPSDFAFAERRAAEVVTVARDWITRQQKPWFAWVHVFDPHSPYAPPKPFSDEYGSNLYAGEVAYTDSALGPLLELARRSGRPTTVIVTADHGEGLGDHGEATHGVFAYESTLHVPLIVAQVGGGSTASERSFVSDAPVRHIDIVPTIAALAGLEMKDLPGRSLLDAARGDTDERPAYFEAMTAMLKRGWAPLRGVIVGREKYIDLPIEELYDLHKDAQEKNNLVPTAGEKARTLAGRLSVLDATLPGEQTKENGEVRARLQSLGYLSGSAPRKERYTEDDDPKRLIDVDRLMMQGIELHLSGHSAEAIDAYRRVIARRPDMGLAYRRLAYIQWEGGATREAIRTLRDALSRSGSDVEIEIRLGTYLAESGDAAEAVPLLERATRAAPENTDGANALGIAYARANRTYAAIDTFQRILATDPRNGFALENLGTTYLARGDLTAAKEAFDRAVTAAPRSARSQAGLGVIASEQGRVDEAIARWRRAVDLDPRNFDALFNLSSTLIRTGRTAEARPFVIQFVRTAPRELYGPDVARFEDWLRRQ